MKPSERRAEAAQAEREHNTEREVNFQAMMADLHYPVTRSGDRIDLTLFKFHIAYHLTRCGWRHDPDKREIKARPVNVRGVVMDAVEWVAAEAEDDPLENLADMRMSEIQDLPPVWRAEALRRLTGKGAPVVPRNAKSWHVTPNVQYIDEPRGFDDSAKH
jgi:hypothetical protein